MILWADYPCKCSWA